jgi:uncharacterized protein (DUF305 family)
MTVPHLGGLTTALVTAVALAACGSTPRGGVEAAPAPATSDARYRYTEADVRFMSDMIGHHAQALVMAGWAPTHGASPPVRRLAERIINGQQDEISTMQRWLRDRGQPVPEPHETSHHHHHLMPGMLTPDQMKQLDQARGAEFDRLFLSSMIRHHRGAVTMVEDLFGSQGAAQDETVFKFANDASVDQTTEIARMERMLSALPSGQSSS